MPTFVCNNKECGKYGVEDYYSSVTYRLVEGSLQAACLPCPCCGKEREEVNPNSNIPLSKKNIGVGLYSSASKEGKQEMLKKRAHDHFEKEVKPFKEHQLNEAISQMKKYKNGQ